MDLPARKQKIEQELQQALAQAQQWTTRGQQLSGQLTLVNEMLKEREEQPEDN